MENWPSPVVLVGIGSILVAVIALVVTLSVHIQKVSKWSGEVDADRKTFNAFMAEIRNDIKRIFERLPSNIISGRSPLRLTDLGKAIASDLNASMWAANFAEKLVAEVKGMETHEVQEFCFTFVQQHVESDPLMQQDVKRAAYNHGIHWSDAKSVYVIELRDKLLLL